MYNSARRLIPLLLVVPSLAVAQAPPPAPRGTPAEVVGRWSLIAVIRIAEDVTQFGVTQGRAVSVYEFKADGTFSITRDALVIETGTWAADASVTPRTFDHVPNVRGRPGRFIPGIYESGGGVLKICIFPPSEASTRPTRCEAKPENGSRIYIMSRETR